MSFWSRQSGLLECEELLDIRFVSVSYSAGVGQIALLLLGLFGQDVALVGMFSLDLSCSGKGEPLFGTGISLNLWHCECC